jgi:hypothetical protein
VKHKPGVGSCRGCYASYPEYSRADSYSWSPFPPEAGPSGTRSSQSALAGFGASKRWKYEDLGQLGQDEPAPIKSSAAEQWPGMTLA